MAFRILASFGLLFSVLFMPFWLSIVFGLGAMIYFSFFWEAVILFLLSDLLYGIGENRFFHITYLSLITSVLLLTALEILKKKTNFIQNHK